MENNEINGFKRLTESAKRVLKDAFELAVRFESKELRAMHIFYVLLSDSESYSHEVFERLGVDIPSTLEQLKNEISKIKNLSRSASKSLSQPKLSDEVKNTIQEAFFIASKSGFQYVGTAHLLLAMFTNDEINLVSDLRKIGIGYDKIEKLLYQIGAFTPEQSYKPKSKPKFSLPLPMFDQPDSDEENRFVPNFCTDMIEESKKGKYMEIVGREKEIKRLLHILSRKTKNNPILVGDAGVGKTAIVEGLANMIVEGNVPASFMDKKILSLDVAGILAGARLRGDVEERVIKIIDSVIESGDTILFIDEIHMIVGAGSGGGRDSLDIANILKPYLTKSDLSIIGATTYDEYSKFFEPDAALTRRFQPIFVEEIDIDSAKHVMYTIAKDFADYHKVKIQNEAIEESVELSAKFIQDRYLPDKAIDILDEAAASIKIGREVAIEPELSKLGEKLIKIQDKKNQAINANNLKEASMYKKQEDIITKEIQAIIEGKKKVKKTYPKTVTAKLIRDIIVDWTSIPLVASDISDKTLRDLDKRLSKRVVGQTKAVGNVTKAIQRTHIGLNDGKRPLASFLFLGPTGVGKTELAKALAYELFGSENLLKQVDMSEFMEQHSVSKLIGSPPGYIGFQEGGQLTTFVKRKPYCVILFDEIEKAHPDVLNILLQILEEGHLTDSKGSKVSFKNTIIILTSNIGAEEVANDNTLGFDIDIERKEGGEIDEAFEEMEEKLLGQLRKTLRPELLNRIDSINVFRGLNKEDCLQISKNLVDQFILRLVEKGIVLNVSSAVVRKINEEGYSKEYGGRNIRRKVQELLEDGLAQFLISSKNKRNKNEVLKLQASLDKNNIVFSFVD
ncbi:MAG: ATP-dependent Clp protease ATP-binding subunit ClpC [Candidatus Dojkabacteria bacterium]|nr:MAG: ATP-dependent Clp protease ATP-binding subunit ClpC [Candidatus Dojkabacteria bacterium]